MKKIKSLVLLTLIIGLTTVSCSKEGTSEPNQKSGAVCNDGTTSTSTGSGTCSGHGGVQYWLY